jgi:hypothetical protein
MAYTDTKQDGRRWYHPWPKPARRADLMGFNAMFWMAAGWIIFIALLVWW